MRQGLLVGFLCAGDVASCCDVNHVTILPTHPLTACLLALGVPPGVPSWVPGRKVQARRGGPPTGASIQRGAALRGVVSQAVSVVRAAEGAVAGGCCVGWRYAVAATAVSVSVYQLLRLVLA